jgi:lipoyl(octanoyl) transferase
MKQQVLFEDLGVKPYKETWDYQEALLQQSIAAKRAGKPATQRLIFVEHPPVYTLGKSGNEANLLINEQQRAAKGVEYFHINRGGDITFHGPGQLVGYPILDLETFRTDLGWYLRSLEEVIILTLADYGIQGTRSKGETGVWIEPDVIGRARKICAMGIRCSRWITMHGFALNVNTNLNFFNDIIPCGIVNKKVTSLQEELGHEVSFEEMKEKVKGHFEEVFGAELVSNEVSVVGSYQVDR